MQRPHLTCLSSSGLSHGCTDVLNCGKSYTALCLCPCLTKLCRWDRPERVTKPSPEMRIWLALILLEQKETMLSNRKLANEKKNKNLAGTNPYILLEIKYPLQNSSINCKTVLQNCCLHSKCSGNRNSFSYLLQHQYK